MQYYHCAYAFYVPWFNVVCSLQMKDNDVFYFYIYINF